MSKKRSVARPPVPAPAWPLLWLEIPRTFFELSASLVWAPEPTRSTSIPSPGAIVLPGLGAGDPSTAMLRFVLGSCGVRAEGWGLGRNTGELALLEATSRSVRVKFARERRKLTLIGHSLGGIIAREVARAIPQMIARVITLGAPFGYRRSMGDQTSAGWVLEATDILGGHWPGQDRLESQRPPMPVPTTNIYSRTDGLVRWELCVDQASATAENIEVHGSHCGLILNPAVARIIALKARAPAATS
jgi:pimeloyl-ACP methyl ester carboxylesterase